MRGLGTIINTVLVLAGSGIGYFVGHRISDTVRVTVVQTVGLVTIALGVSDAIDTHNMVFPLVGMVIGALIGELLGIEDRLEALGHVLQRRFAKSTSEPAEGKTGKNFVTGFVTATLLFCVGPLTILGAIEDATGQTPQLYIIKGSLDGFVAVIFTATYGIGVAFSALSVFVVQGTLTLLGSFLDSALDERMRIELFAAGGLAVIAIGINLLEIKRIRLGSLLPGLLVTPVLVAIFAR